MNIALFGTIFMDIKGFSQNHYDPVGRNVGDIKFIHGGVGRNVAENLGVLDIPVTFGSTVDETGIGQEVINRLTENGVETAFLKKTKTGGMGMWMAILDHEGNLAGSISKMPDFHLFEELIDEKAEEMIASASHVALEIDLNETITRRIMALAKKHCKPIYGIPGNLEVIKRNKDILADMDCFICNDIEAEKLFPAYLDLGKISSVQAELKKFAEKLKMKSMVVTLGELGAVYYEAGKTGYCCVASVKMVDSTGAGDSFFSGVIARLVQGDGLKEAVAFGAKVAAYTIQSEESTCIGIKI